MQNQGIVNIDSLCVEVNKQICKYMYELCKNTIILKDKIKNSKILHEMQKFNLVVQQSYFLDHAKSISIDTLPDMW